MTRTDVHSPTNLVTEDYEYLFAADLETPWALGLASTPEGKAFLAELNNYAPETAHRGSHQCHHCGAWIRYVAWLRHMPTGYTIVVGETCLDNRFSVATPVFQAMRKAAALDRKAQRIRKLVAEFQAANEDLGWMGIKKHEDRVAAMPAASANNGFIHDVARKLNQYGTLSERQVQAIRNAVVRDAKWAADKAAEATAEQAAPAGPVPTGKVTITGTVVSRKWHDSDYGSTIKLTIKLENGSRVWVTEPGKVQAQVGDTITLNCNVTASDKDNTFGFGKRPTQATVTAKEAQ
jgi:hypothetical protein